MQYEKLYAEMVGAAEHLVYYLLEYVLHSYYHHIQHHKHIRLNLIHMLQLY